MTRDAAVVTVVVALAAGYYWRKWAAAETDDDAAKARAGAARKVLWRARLAMACMVLVLIAVVDVWVRGHAK